MNFNEVPFVDKHYIVNFLGKFIGGFKFCFGGLAKIFGVGFVGTLGKFVILSVSEVSAKIYSKLVLCVAILVVKACKC